MFFRKVYCWEHIMNCTQQIIAILHRYLWILQVSMKTRIGCTDISFIVSGNGEYHPTIWRIKIDGLFQWKIPFSKHEMYAFCQVQCRSEERRVGKEGRGRGSPERRDIST